MSNILAATYEWIEREKEEEEKAMKEKRERERYTHEPLPETNDEKCNRLYGELSKMKDDLLEEMSDVISFMNSVEPDKKNLGSWYNSDIMGDVILGETRYLITTGIGDASEAIDKALFCFKIYRTRLKEITEYDKVRKTRKNKRKMPR